MPRRRRTSALAAALFCVAVLCCAAPARAQNLVLSNLVVDNQSGALTARYGVALDSLAEATDALTNGVTLALICRGKLAKAGGVFSGPQVAAAEMTSRIKYDSLTKEYTLIVPGREGPLKGPRLDEILRAGWGSMALSMGSWSVLERGAEYTLSLDIRLQQVDIPNWFRRTLFFWSWDMAPQTSYQLHFKY